MLVLSSEALKGVFLMDFFSDLGGKKCVQGSHLPAQSARIVITIPPRIRRHIPTGWRLRNIAGSARNILCIRKPNKQAFLVLLFVLQ